MSSDRNKIVKGERLCSKKFDMIIISHDLSIFLQDRKLIHVSMKDIKQTPRGCEQLTLMQK